MKKNNVSCTWTIISIYYNKLKNICSKIHSNEKFFWGKQTSSPFFSIIILVHYIPFAPYYINDIILIILIDIPMASRMH